MSMISDILIPIMLYSMIDGKKYAVFMLVALLILKWISFGIQGPMTTKLAASVSNTYFSVQIERYTMLNADSRNKLEASDMYSIVRDISDRLANLTAQSMWECCILVEAALSTIVMFWYRGYLHLIVILILIQLIWYRYIAIHALADCRTTRDTSRSETTALNHKNQRLLPELQQCSAGASDIVTNMSKSTMSSYITQISYEKLWIMNDGLGQATVALVMIYVYGTGNPVDIIVLYYLISKFNFAINRCTMTYTQIAKVDTALEKYEKKWDKLIKYQPVKPLIVPETGLIFDYLQVSRDGFSIKAHNLVIERGLTYIVTGESGCGKSTLCSALIGDILGGVLSDGADPASYRQCFSMSYQSRKFHDSDITLREILTVSGRDTPQDDEIMNLLNLVELTGWLKGLVEKKNDTNVDAEEKQYIIHINDDDDNDSKAESTNLLTSIISDIRSFKVTEKQDIKPANCEINPLDVKLNGLSGGQKTRIDLVRAVLRAKNPNVSIVILDEPDNGVDQKQGMRMLKNILGCSQLHGKTKIITTHICECQLKQLTYDQHWHMSDGTLRVLE